MIKIEIKNRFTGSVIFTYEKENATIKDAVEQAVKERANLIGADLRDADLRDANLIGSDLYCANLIGSDLYCANLRDANLRGADLRDADLRDVDLRDAKLIGANLRDVDLRYANLRDADLIGADLYCANLRDADLRDANLRGSDLRGAKNKEHAYLPMYCKWSHAIIGDKIKIGCKAKTIEEWDLFFASDETYETDRNTEDFKQIQAIYLAYKAYLTHLKS